METKNKELKARQLIRWLTYLTSKFPKGMVKYICIFKLGGNSS